MSEKKKQKYDLICFLLFVSVKTSKAEREKERERKENKKISNTQITILWKNLFHHRLKKNNEARSNRIPCLFSYFVSGNMVIW